MPSYDFIKRAFDLILSILLLLLLSPLFIFIALLIKSTSQGPIFYPSSRVGYNGKNLTCWKFRTMHLDADERLKKILRESKELKREWETFQKLKKDPRVIPIGNFLRKMSFDELPQLWNILKGDMSLVGPRPFLKDQINRIDLNERDCLLSVKPGLTGLWQVSGRSDLPFHKKVELDIYYAKHLNLWIDTKIFFKTFFILAKKEGAY